MSVKRFDAVISTNRVLDPEMPRKNNIQNTRYIEFVDYPTKPILNDILRDISIDIK